MVKNQSRRHKRCGFDPWRRAWQPTPVFLPGESSGRGAWWAIVHGVAELDMTEVTEHAYISLKAFFSRLKAVASTQENFESEIYWTFWGGGGLAIKQVPCFMTLKVLVPQSCPTLQPHGL